MYLARWFTLLFASFILMSPVKAARRSERRSDLDNAPPVSLSGYQVPLQGSETCTAPGICTNSLPAPSSNKILKYLTIARGIDIYSCEGRKPTETPLFMTQDTTVWDAAPLLPYLDNEAMLQSIVEKLQEFDYTSLKNSTLTCIGTIKSIKADSVIELFNVDYFHTHVQDVVNAPDKPDINLQWARSLSLDFSWEVYRVETIYGAPPKSCQNASGFELDYAAEYWFYHA